MGNSADNDNEPRIVDTTPGVLKDRSFFRPKPVDMNIRKFKKHLDTEFPNLTQTEKRHLIKQYKERAWRDYHALVNDKGDHPTHSATKDEDGKQGE